MTPHIEQRLAEIAAEKGYHPASEYVHAMRLAVAAALEWQTLMSAPGGEAVAERSPKAPGGINWLCDVLPERGTKLYLHPAPAADDAVLRDAERYRWLRSEIENGAVQGVSGALVELYDETMYDDGDELDAAIDAAMAKEQGDAKSDR